MDLKRKYINFKKLLTDGQTNHTTTILIPQENLKKAEKILNSPQITDPTIKFR